VIHFERVAWVPSAPQTDQAAANRAIELAVVWVEQQCVQQGAGAILVTTTPGERTPPSPVLAGFGRRHQRTTAPARDTDQLAVGVGPVLAVRPDAETLDYAMSLARGSSLAVVESELFPLHGWAREVDALDLTRPDDPPVGRDPHLAHAIDSLVYYGANAPHYDRQARHVLTGLHGLDLLDRDTLVGAVAARGVSPAGLRRLSTLVDTVTDRWLPRPPARSGLLA
jgi:hypothetical protein